MPVTLLIGNHQRRVPSGKLINARDGGPLTGPHCDLWPINHVVGDPATGTIWAAGGNDWNGAGVWRSDDGGESWTLTPLSLGQREEFHEKMNPTWLRHSAGKPSAPAPFTDEVEAIWSLHFAHGVLWAGGKPGVLFRSNDRGDHVGERSTGLTDHSSRENWNGGAAGLILHTLVTDPSNPAKLWAGISAAGVFASEDGGETWERRNRLSNAERTVAITTILPHRATGIPAIAFTT